jgi:hypothetical protein
MIASPVVCVPRAVGAAGRLAARLDDGDEQCLQQFVNQSPWDPVASIHACNAKGAAAPRGRRRLCAMGS